MPKMKKNRSFFLSPPNLRRRVPLISFQNTLSRSAIARPYRQIEKDIKVVNEGGVPQS